MPSPTLGPPPPGKSPHTRRMFPRDAIHFTRTTWGNAGLCQRTYDRTVANHGLLTHLEADRIATLHGRHINEVWPNETQLFNQRANQYRANYQRNQYKQRAA
jgi:hypothetical protein